MRRRLIWVFVAISAMVALAFFGVFLCWQILVKVFDEDGNQIATVKGHRAEITKADGPERHQRAPDESVDEWDAVGSVNSVVPVEDVTSAGASRVPFDTAGRPVPDDQRRQSERESGSSCLSRELLRPASYRPFASTQHSA